MVRNITTRDFYHEYLILFIVKINLNNIDPGEFPFLTNLEEINTCAGSQKKIYI